MNKWVLGYNTNSEVKKLCYTSLVRPILDYSTSRWYPSNKNMIKEIESVQRYATKYILDNFYMDYKPIDLV